MESPGPLPAAEADGLRTCRLPLVHPSDSHHLKVAYEVLGEEDEASYPTELRPYPLELPLEPLSPEALAQVGWGPTGDNDRFRK